ncbi:MAG: phosphotransferase [Novosphingobium sp.]|nr:phosphotransferase [Novosphingobium sp.]
MTETNLFSLPVEIDGITRDWLETALSGYAPGVRVRDFEMVDFIRTTCTKIRLRLDLENNPPDAPIPNTVMLKGGFEPHSRAMAHMHMTETMSYATLMPAFDMRTPEIYFSRWDEEAQQGIVIMEDLVARGVDFCKPTRPQSFEQVARRLEELARLHAGTWGSPRLEPGETWGWLSDTPTHLLDYFGPFLEAEVWDPFIEAPRGAAASTRFHDREWMHEAMVKTGIYSEGQPRCACHGDTHLGNLYIDTDGTPGFFDCISYKAPGMFEVAYHLTCALDVADRKRWEGALIQHYLNALRSHGVSPPGFDEAMHQFAVYLAYGYLVFVINDAIFQPEAYNTAYTARFSQAMLDHDTIGKLAAIQHVR